MPSPGTCKCSSCKTFFKPNPRSKGRQHFCSRPECRKASKRASQQKWLNKPENREHFRGPANIQRVQRWRANNPGYWKKVQQSSGAGIPLQETLITQPIEKQEESIVLKREALQELLITQGPVLIELIAHLTGVALQDSIARTGQDLRE